MKEIKLTKGYVALVDDEDYDWLMQFKWCCAEQGSGKMGVYAVRASYDKGKRGIIRMHRQILGEYNMRLHIDHIDGNGLNNQRSNLRICTPSENLRNRGAARTSKTGVKGVSQDKHGKFLSTLKVDGKYIYVGYFNTIDEAAVAYNKAAQKHHGEFAKLNTI